MKPRPIWTKIGRVINAASVTLALHSQLFYERPVIAPLSGATVVESILINKATACDLALCDARDSTDIISILIAKIWLPPLLSLVLLILFPPVSLLPMRCFRMHSLHDSRRRRR
jgi:hypothetical protein